MVPWNSAHYWYYKSPKKRGLHNHSESQIQQGSVHYFKFVNVYKPVYCAYNMNTVFHFIRMFQIADGLRSSSQTFCQFTKKMRFVFF